MNACVLQSESECPSLHAGPHRLDLGDILYAPNTLTDPQGRTLMFAWLQELRKGGGFDYAGCLSLPRVLSLRGNNPSSTPSLVHKLQIL